jgi:hypothetical protein
MALPERLGRMNAASDQARQSAIVWSGWRDLNSRPLDPQTCETRIRLLSTVLTAALLSVKSGLSPVVRDCL